MPTPRPLRPDRKTLRAWVTFLLLGVAAGAQPLDERARRVPAPPADSAGAFSDLAASGGRLFAVYASECFWSPDSGRTWTRQEFTRPGPKGPAPAMEGGRFTRAGGGIWLGNREAALAWRFDAQAGRWSPWPAGAGAIAAAGAGDRLYSLTPAHRLLATRNLGDTWEDIPLPDSVRAGTFFDDMLAEGENLVLRARDPGNDQRAARSLDGGATWAFLEPHALPVLAHGRLYAFAGSRVLIQGPGAGEESRPAPRARAAFADPAGGLYAWSDSGLYAMDAFGPGGWERLAGPEALRDWSAGKAFLFRLRDGTLSWFDGSAADPAEALHPPAPPRRSRGAPGFLPATAGRPGIGFDFAGKRWDGLGRRR